MHVTTNDIHTRTTWPNANELWHKAQELGYPAAIWRLPNSTEKHLILQTDTDLTEAPVDLEELAAGFVMSRFANFDQGDGSPFQALLFTG